MQNVFKEKKNLLIITVFIVLGALLLFINPAKEAFRVTEDDAVKEEINASSNEVEVKEGANSTNINPSDPKQDKFNQAILDGDKYFLTKDYQQSIIYYNEALSYNNSQIAYLRLFNAYNTINDVNKAIESIDKAIAIKPSFTNYWNTKIQYLDEKTNVSFTDLKKIYQEGLLKVDTSTKVNLVTSFAVIAENNYQKSEAIALWNYAIELYPQNKLIYQAEIDRLKN